MRGCDRLIFDNKDIGGFELVRNFMIGGGNEGRDLARLGFQNFRNPLGVETFHGKQKKCLARLRGEALQSPDCVGS